VPWKIEPKMISRSTGSENVKTTASRVRKNDFSSSALRPRPSRVADGSLAAAGALAWVMEVMA